MFKLPFIQTKTRLINKVNRDQALQEVASQVKKIMATRGQSLIVMTR